MLWKTIKYGAAGGAAALALGLLLFGNDLLSYTRSSARSVQTAVKDSVPLEFEIQRARDLAEQVIPELQANIRLIAQEEVEIGGLKQDIAESEVRLEDQRQRLAGLQQRLETVQASYTLGSRRYSREQLVQELADQFAHFREAQDILAGKERLLQTRESALAAAMQALEKTRRQKDRLEQQIAALEAQHRLVQAASIGSGMVLDNTQLAQAQRLIGNIKKRLDVAERVLAHEAQFVQALPQEEVIDEAELLAEVQRYLDGEPAAEADVEVR